MALRTSPLFNRLATTPAGRPHSRSGSVTQSRHRYPTASAAAITSPFHQVSCSRERTCDTKGPQQDSVALGGPISHALAVWQRMKQRPPEPSASMPVPRSIPAPVSACNATPNMSQSRTTARWELDGPPSKVQCGNTLGTEGQHKPSTLALLYRPVHHHPAHRRGCGGLEPLRGR